MLRGGRRVSCTLLSPGLELRGSRRQGFTGKALYGRPRGRSGKTRKVRLGNTYGGTAGRGVAGRRQAAGPQNENHLPAALMFRRNSAVLTGKDL
jgi:hypothetical protein